MKSNIISAYSGDSKNYFLMTVTKDLRLNLEFFYYDRFECSDKSFSLFYDKNAEAFLLDLISSCETKKEEKRKIKNVSSNKIIFWLDASLGQKVYIRLSFTDDLNVSFFFSAFVKYDLLEESQKMLSLYQNFKYNNYIELLEGF